MKIPNSDKARISQDKLLHYILSETHSIGKFKAKYFNSLGFNNTNIDLFQKTLLSIIESNEVTDYVNSPYGIKYIIDGEINTPNKTKVRLRTVWIIEKGESDPRFVTVYPV